MRGNLGATDQTATIGPKASETARELLSIAESMLGGRLSQAGIRPQEEAVRRYILTQYPLYSLECCAYAHSLSPG